MKSSTEKDCLGFGVGFKKQREILGLSEIQRFANFHFSSDQRDFHNFFRKISFKVILRAFLSLCYLLT